MQCHTQDLHHQLRSLLLVFCFLPYGHIYSWMSNCLCWKDFVFCLGFSLAVAVTQGWSKPFQGCPCLHWHANLSLSEGRMIHSFCGAFAVRCIHSSSQTQPMEAMFSAVWSANTTRANPWTCTYFRGWLSCPQWFSRCKTLHVKKYS